MENELYHAGRKGMKWGQHIFCGPKCDKHGSKGKGKQKAEDETPEQKKERILKSRSARALYDNADLFTTQELNSAYTRLVLENNIKNLAPAEVSKGQKFVNKFNSNGKNIHDVFETGSKLYNDAAKVYNTFFKGDGDPLPLIKDNDKKSDKKADNKKSNNESGKKSDDSDKSQKDKSTDTKADTKKEKTETYEGEVVGEGNSKKKDKTQTKSSSNDIFEAEWYETPVTDLATTNSVDIGKNYIDNLLDDED